MVVVGTLLGMVMVDPPCSLQAKGTRYSSPHTTEFGPILVEGKIYISKGGDLGDGQPCMQAMQKMNNGHLASRTAECNSKAA